MIHEWVVARLAYAELKDRAVARPHLKTLHRARARQFHRRRPRAGPHAPPSRDHSDRRNRTNPGARFVVSHPGRFQARPCPSGCASVRSAMNQAYATRDAGRARLLLHNLARRLEHQHPGAAAALREGLDETLTVMRLGLPQNLERVLSSPNLIENLFSRVREIGHRVKHWQSGTMVLRWTATAVLEAERGFRKLAGYRAMPTLVAALHAPRYSTRSQSPAGLWE
ncbi:MAG: transposase [Candidatus Binatus sp.]|uniref:transposase n=1 Tax=Candidatus Binatus sp. TaxID=2811406 RepID=UPI0027188DA7|nr:transposase [Candidatus Binatus sp.]MDO8433843.1 transposase [Candidatus Binatus sp.]